MASFIPSTVSLWHNLDLLLEIAQVYHVLNLELKKILVNIQRIMVKGPENKAYSMLDYDINAAQSVNVVHRMKIQFII
jgi:hypothetical protein